MEEIDANKCSNTYFIRLEILPPGFCEIILCKILILSVPYHYGSFQMLWFMTQKCLDNYCMCFGSPCRKEICRSPGTDIGVHSSRALSAKLKRIISRIEESDVSGVPWTSHRIFHISWLGGFWQFSSHLEIWSCN